IFSSIRESYSRLSEKPRYCIVGVATPGGVLSKALRAQLIEALELGMSVVSGLHEFLSEDPEMLELAKRQGVEIIDVRKPKKRTELHFWSGEILNLKIPRIAVMGTDCALGKRTTAKMLTDTCRKK